MHRRPLIEEGLGVFFTISPAFCFFHGITGFGGWRQLEGGARGRRAFGRDLSQCAALAFAWSATRVALHRRSKCCAFYPWRRLASLRSATLCGQMRASRSQLSLFHASLEVWHMSCDEAARLTCASGLGCETRSTSDKGVVFLRLWSAFAIFLCSASMCAYASVLVSAVDRRQSSATASSRATVGGL